MSEAFQINPAVRAPRIPLVGVAGGTGSGKSMSALLMAWGMCGPGGRIVAVDTERGRLTEYAKKADGTEVPGLEGLEFFTLDLEPPYRPGRYVEAITAAMEYAGETGVVIVDSISHEHEGQGGLLDWHDEVALRMARGNASDAPRYNFPAWAEPKAAHKDLVELLVSRRSAGIILTFRAKEAYEAKGGKVTSKGMQPITDAGLPYECSCFMMLYSDAPGVPVFTHKALHATMVQEGVFPTKGDGYAQITRAHGERIMAWAQGGERPLASTEVKKVYIVVTLEGEEKARTLDGYVKFWNDICLKAKRENKAGVLYDWHQKNAARLKAYAEEEPAIRDVLEVIRDVLEAPAEPATPDDEDHFAHLGGGRDDPDLLGDTTKPAAPAQDEPEREGTLL